MTNVERVTMVGDSWRGHAVTPPPGYVRRRVCVEGAAHLPRCGATSPPNYECREPAGHEGFHCWRATR